MATVTCSSCGHENPEESSFCLECGSPLGISCDGCGAELPANAKFCNRCGHSASSHPRADPDRDPRSYTPKHLADKILQSKSALEGERKRTSQETRKHVLVFFGLVATIIVARALLSPSTGFAASVGLALGGAVIEIPAALGIGLAILWFADKLSLFVLNAIRPDEAKDAFSRTIWQTLSLSLVFGFPAWLLASRYTP